MPEVTQILGASIGMPHLRYVSFSDACLRMGLIGNGGLSPDAADLLIQTNRGISSGPLMAQPCSPRNTTPTTLQQFAASIFAPAFTAAPDASLVDRLTGRVLAMSSWLPVPNTEARLSAAAP